MSEIETFNKFMVGMSGNGLTIMRLPQPLSDDDAVLLAAWLVAMAMRPTHPFEKVLEAVQST